MQDTVNIIVSNEKFMPTTGTEDSAGYDLKITNDIVLAPGASTTVGTGVKFQIPRGYWGLVAPRSSMGRVRVSLDNTIGIIDSDYQGEILLKVHNGGRETFMAYTGDSLVQILLVPVFKPKLVPVGEFKEVTKRGAEGFGSTGKDGKGKL